MTDYYLQARPELRSFLPAEYSRVLEIGCAAGAFFGNYKPGTEVWGVEPSAAAAASAAQRLYRVLSGTYDAVAAQLPDNYFDLLVINDVIEHMPDDAGFLRAVQAKLMSGAHITGSIPNMRHWPVLRDLVMRKEWAYQDEGVLDRTHLRFYTEVSFPRLLRECGFGPLRFEGINNTLSGSKRLRLRLFSGGRLADVGFMQFAFLAQRKRS